MIAVKQEYRVTMEGMPVYDLTAPLRRKPGLSAPASRWLVGCCLLACLVLTGCKMEIYQGLTEAQANVMLSTLLQRGIRAEKEAVGKKGYTILVDEKQIVQALQILKDNNLPRDNFATLGSVFAGQGMIASPTEEKSRLAYAISQELSDTFSRIDGVLTSRVHIVLAETDQATDTRIPPSAAVFLRHTPNSQVVTMVPKIRELVANAVPSLSLDRVSVMLLPVREEVAVPMAGSPSLLDAPDGPFPVIRVALFLAAMLSALALAVWGGVTLLRGRFRKDMQ